MFEIGRYIVFFCRFQVLRVYQSGYFKIFYVQISVLLVLQNRSHVNNKKRSSIIFIEFKLFNNELFSVAQ